MSDPDDKPVEKVLGLVNEVFMAAARGAIRGAATHVQGVVRKVDDRLSEVRGATKPAKLPARRRPRSRAADE